MNDPLSLRLHPDAVLLQDAATVGTGDPEAIVAYAMLERCRKWQGYALAAPQIGWSARAFVIPRHRDLPPSCPEIVFNPELSKPGPLVWMDESCLSIPGFRARVSRPSSVVLDYTDGRGQRRAYRCSGLLARVVQHEYDHLRGRLFVDRLGDLGHEAWRAYEAQRGRTIAPR